MNGKTLGLALALATALALTLSTGVGAVDDREEFARFVVSNNTTTGNAVSAQLFITGLGANNPPSNADGLANVSVHLCQFDPEASGQVQMSCWDGENILGTDALWWSDGEEGVQCQFFGSTNEAECTVTNQTLPLTPGLWSVHVEAEIQRDLDSNSFVEASHDIRVSPNPTWDPVVTHAWNGTAPTDPGARDRPLVEGTNRTLEVRIHSALSLGSLSWETAHRKTDAYLCAVNTTGASNLDENGNGIVCWDGEERLRTLDLDGAVPWVSTDPGQSGGTELLDCDTNRPFIGNPDPLRVEVTFECLGTNTLPDAGTWAVYTATDLTGPTPVHEAHPTEVSMVEVEHSFGAQDHSVGTLNENETNTMLFFGIIMAAAMVRGYWFLAFVYSLGFIQPIFNEPVLGFPLTFSLAFVATWAQFAALNFNQENRD